MTGGSEELLQSCLNDPVTWSQDPLIFRLAHAHSASIQSCRENRSPSLHVVFLKVGDEPLQALGRIWMDMGRKLRKSRIAHLGEFLYHKVTFQNNDQERMFENLERSFSSPLGISPDPIPLTLRDRLTLFTDKTVSSEVPALCRFPGYLRPL